MNLEDELLREHSRRHAERIARWVGSDRRRFGKLMDLLLKGDTRTAQLASWPVGICAEWHPGLVRPYLSQMIRRMQEPGVHEAVRRTVVRMLQCIDIPRELLGAVTTLCFDYLSSAGASIAVKACAMTVLMRIAKDEPEIGRELRLVVERQLPYASAAVKARARMLLKEIR
jgi:hypothetical protein